MGFELATFLKAKRTAAGLTQIEVSKVLGYSSPQFISNWERGMASPPISAMAKIMKLYSIGSNEVIDLYVMATKKRLERAFQMPVKSKLRNR